MSEKLTVAEALAKAEQIDVMLGTIHDTAPEAVRAMGGHDALARRSEMTCIGPVPRLDAETWERMSQEYEGRRVSGSINWGRQPQSPPSVLGYLNH